MGLESMEHHSRGDHPQPRPARTKLDTQLDRLRDEANNDWREKKQVVDYLRKHVRRHPSDGDKLVEAGGVSLLMALLTHDIESHSPSPPIDLSSFMEIGSSPSKEHTTRIAPQSTSTEQAHAITASLHLLSYLTSSVLGRSALSTEQSLRTFLRCMGNGYEEEARSLACRCLGNLLLNDSVLQLLSRQQKLTAEVVQALKSLLSCSSSQCLTMAIRTARQASTLKRDLIRAGFVAAVGSLLVQQDDVEVLQHALSCLTTFANELTATVHKEKSIITPLMNERDRLMVHLARDNRAFVPRLLTLTSHETPGIQQLALDLLCLLSTNGSIRGDMGSNGVMACFLEHLGFDEGQTTVSSMQKKIVYALSTCCYDGYNRVKLKDLGGIPVLLSVLGSSLYDSVHLHILSCLPEFRHDERTLESLIKNGVVPLATRHLQSAMQILFPVGGGSKNKRHTADTVHAQVENTPLVASEETLHDSGETSNTRAPPSVIYSASSPSYQREVQANYAAQNTPIQNRQEWPMVSAMLDSPVFSPPSLPQEMREYEGSPGRSMWSGNPFSPGRFSGQSSPSSVTSPTHTTSLESDGGGGRWSPVVHQEEAMDTDNSQLVTAVANLGLEKEASPSTSGLDPPRSPLKRKLSDEPSEHSPNRNKKLHTSTDTETHTVTDNISSKWTKRNAEKVIDYIMAFFGSISYRNELAPSLTGKSTLGSLVAYLSHNTKSKTRGSNTSSQATPEDAVSILAHIIRSHLCFQPLIKHGFPLMLHHPDFIEVNTDGRGNTKEKTSLLKQMRRQGESHFGFGELLHLCLRSSPEVRLTCIASAALLLQTSADRRKFFGKEGVMDQLIQVAMNLEGNVTDRVMFAQALHGFFVAGSENHAQEATHMPTSTEDVEDDAPMECCQYAESLLGLTSAQEASLSVDDGQYLLVNRRRLSASSEVFEAMLTAGHFMEGQRDKVVKISETSLEALTLLVHHLCGCEVRECPVMQFMFHQALVLLDVVQLSDQYLAFELKQAALDELIQERLTAENIAVVYERSVERQLGFVADEVINWVLASTTIRPLERAVNLDALLASQYGNHILQEVKSRVEARYLS